MQHLYFSLAGAESLIYSMEYMEAPYWDFIFPRLFLVDIDDIV